MPYTFRIDPELGVVFFEATGIFSQEDLDSGVKAVFAHTAFKPEFVHLIDLRNVTGFATNASQMRARARRDHNEKRFGDTKIAVVAPRPDVFGMSRIYETFSSEAPYEFRVFRNMESATEWLGLSYNGS